MLFSIKTVINWLEKHNIRKSPAQIHGRLVATILTKDNALLVDFSNDLVQGSNAETSFLHSWAQDIRQQLVSEYQFNLILQEEDASFKERLTALQQWSEEFLESATPLMTSSVLQQDIMELITQLYEILRIDANVTSDYKEQDLDFIEVVEYMRLLIIQFAHEHL